MYIGSMSPGLFAATLAYSVTDSTLALGLTLGFLGLGCARLGRVLRSLTPPLDREEIFSTGYRNAVTLPSRDCAGTDARSAGRLFRTERPHQSLEATDPVARRLSPYTARRSHRIPFMTSRCADLNRQGPK